jgi:Motility quorum-sensing regulator, toxin of MqsA
MVTHRVEKRAKPECSLARIRELAAQQAVHYGSSRVQKHTDNLGYSFEAVCECLTQLEPEDFHHAERHSANGPWLDVYMISYHGPTAQDDALYIKLKLDRGCVCVVLCSFHLEGAM